MNLDANFNELVNAIVYQAAKDYVFTKDERKKRETLKDLRSSYMDWLTNGMSVIVAEQLELHPQEIAKRIRRNGNADFIN